MDLLLYGTTVTPLCTAEHEVANIFPSEPKIKSRPTPNYPCSVINSSPDIFALISGSDQRGNAKKNTRTKTKDLPSNFCTVFSLVSAHACNSIFVFSVQSTSWRCDTAHSLTCENCAYCTQYTIHSTRSAEHDRFKQSISFHIVSAIKIEFQAWADTRENTVQLSSPHV